MNETGKTVITKSDCAICINCCGIQSHVRDGKLIKVEGMPEHPVNLGKICPKAERLPEIVYSPDRITHPMKKVDGQWQRISWDQALDEISGKLKNIIDEHEPHAVSIIAGSVGVERLECTAFAQRFKGAIQTPNLFSVESGCYVSRIVGRVLTFGRLYGHDLSASKCVILWGHNPTESRPPMAETLQEKIKNEGLRLIVIDPRQTPLAKQGIHISPRPGTDTALALGMMNVMIFEGLYDKEFIDQHATGFDELKEHVKKYTPEEVEKISAVPAAEIKRIARLFANSGPSCIIQGYGSLDRQANNMQNARSLAVLQALSGYIDVPGGWNTTQSYYTSDLRIPVAEPPIGADKFPLFYQRFSVSLGVEEDSFEKSVVTSPYGPETNYPDAVLNEDPYPIKALLVMAGNPAVSWADSEKFKKAVAKLDLVVAMDIFMSETAELADYFLPATTFMESMGMGGLPCGAVHGIPYIMIRRKHIEPVGEAKPDWLIWSELARRLGHEDKFPWNTDEEMVRHFLEPCGVDFEILQNNQRGLFLPNHYGIYHMAGFPTLSGKIELASTAMVEMGFDAIPNHVEPPESPIADPENAKEYPLTLITGARILEYCHTSFRQIPELRKVHPYPEAEIDAGTANDLGIADGESIVVETRKGNMSFKAKISKNMHPKVVSITHGWGAANVNVLISDDKVDPIAGYPNDKAISCKVRKS